MENGSGQSLRTTRLANPKSNARAERTVQQVEDMLRTHLGELEARLGATISNKHPIVAWLVEHIAVIINKHHIPDGESMTAYCKLHGANPKERLAYFGGKSFLFRS